MKHLGKIPIACIVYLLYNLFRVYVAESRVEEVRPSRRDR